jgi:signal transduction histidine kinase
MNWRTSDKTWVGYSAGLGLLFVTFIFTFYQAKKLSVYTQDVRQNSTLMNQLDVLLINAKNVETRYRQFILSKQEVASQYFDSSFIALSKELKVLKGQSDDDQRAELENLEFLINDFATKAGEGIKYYRAQGYRMNQATMTFSLEILQKMERISNAIIHIHEEESHNLNVSYKNLEVTTRAVNYINVVLLVLAILLTAYSLITYLKEHREKQLANERTQAYAIELEKRVNELAAANKELSELRSLEKFAATGRIARTIAHEVRNPLTNINLAADQLRSQLTAKEVNEDVLINMMLRNSNRINQLISDLLNSTKFLELHMEMYSMHALLDETLEMARDRINLQGVKVEKKYGSEDCEIMVDVEKMKIAFLNLIVNAIEAMSPGKGILTLKTSMDDSKCIISVSDNGSGIDKESLNRLFEPYFTNKAKGTGLGLTNTHNIIYTHKGTIEVISALNHGTTFTITLNK